MDKLDLLLCEILLLRRDLAIEILEYKKSCGYTLRDIRRERKVIKKLTTNLPLPKRKFIASIYMQLFKLILKKSHIDTPAAKLR